MWKNHPSVARSSLKLTLYVICKVNCNHRDHFCCQSQSPSFSLSVCCCESSLFSHFLSLLYLFGFHSASFNTHLSLASFYSHRLCHFLLFVPLFSCRSPVSAALLCHFFIISFVFLPCHSLFLPLPPSVSLPHTKKFPPSEVSEVGKEVSFPKSTKITSREYSL